MDYKCLKSNIFEKDEFKLVPIRSEDRYHIMQWRNEQIYHLRQDKPLTKEDQDRYFDEVVSALFNQEKPSQLLFSFLKNNKLMGYGGLVHINWLDKNAEISFIMNSKYEKDRFDSIWKKYINLIEEVAFKELGLNKIYTYAFDLRPHIYPIFESCGFEKEARLRNHKKIDNLYYDIVIHSKLKKYGH